MPGTCTAPAVSRPPGVSPLLPTSPYSWPRSNPIAEVTAPPQLLCKLERGEQKCSPTPHCMFLGGRAFGPPLCRGSAPATPPSKTIAHQRYAFFQPVRLHQRNCCQPTAPLDSLNGGEDEGLVRTRNVYDLIEYVLSIFGRLSDKRTRNWEAGVPQLAHLSETAPVRNH